MVEMGFKVRLLAPDSRLNCCARCYLVDGICEQATVLTTFFLYFQNDYVPCKIALNETSLHSVNSNHM